MENKSFCEGNTNKRKLSSNKRSKKKFHSQWFVWLVWYIQISRRENFHFPSFTQSPHNQQIVDYSVLLCFLISLSFSFFLSFSFNKHSLIFHYLN
jgi:hypothetical protein